MLTRAAAETTATRSRRSDWFVRRSDARPCSDRPQLVGCSRDTPSAVAAESCSPTSPAEAVGVRATALTGPVGT